jgi:hypothetical protein
MKLKTIIIITILGMLSCSTQLFETVNKELDKMEKKFETNGTPSSQNINMLEKKETKSESGKSLFDVITPENKPTAEHKDSPIKIMKDEKKETPANQEVHLSDIESLKREVQTLIQTNEKLMKKYERANKHKTGRSKHNVVSFIQDYDKDITNLKEKVEANKDLLENTINQKDEEFKKLYNQASNKFNDINKKVKAVNEKLTHIETEHLDKIVSLKENLKVDNLSVENDLTAGNARIHKLHADIVELPGMKITKDQITLKKDMKLVIDGETINMNDLVRDYNMFQEFLKKCGNNFENCKPVSQAVIQEQANTQKIILDNLRELREETNKVLMNKQKRFR